MNTVLSVIFVGWMGWLMWRLRVANREHLRELRGEADGKRQLPARLRGRAETSTGKEATDS